MAQSDLEAAVGREIGVSRWLPVTQERIDRFADCTGDHQYIHVDPERAKASPFGTTIAHGFLILSLVAEMMRDVPKIDGVTLSVNYGLNRVRFVAPVPVGSRIRGRFVLARLEEIRPGEVQTTLGVTVEIDGAAKPALVAEWLVRRHFGARHPTDAVGITPPPPPG